MSRRCKWWIVAALTVIIGWLGFWSTSSHYSVRRNLSAHVTLIEYRKVERTPYVGIADNDRSFSLPIPNSCDLLERQVLECNGRPVWEVGAMYGAGHGFHVSPDEHFVAVENAMRSSPMVIIDLTSGTKVEVPDVIPDDQSHYYDYPFQFTRWSDDSSSVFAQVFGDYFERQQSMEYREVWRIDPKTGTCSRVERTVQNAQGSTQ